MHGDISILEIALRTHHSWPSLTTNANCKWAKLQRADDVEIVKILQRVSGGGKCGVK